MKTENHFPSSYEFHSRCNSSFLREIMKKELVKMKTRGAIYIRRQIYRVKKFGLVKNTCEVFDRKRFKIRNPKRVVSFSICFGLRKGLAGLRLSQRFCGQQLWFFTCLHLVVLFTCLELPITCSTFICIFILLLVYGYLQKSCNFHFVAFFSTLI